MKKPRDEKKTQFLSLLPISLLKGNEKFQAYGLRRDANFDRMFDYFLKDMDSLCFVYLDDCEDWYCQIEQKIGEFYNENSNCLEPTIPTAFLFKKGDNYHIAYVRAFPKDLEITTSPYGCGGVLYAGNDRRLVVPELNLKT